MKPLAQQLQEARERAGLSKTELGRRMGWADHSNVVRIEQGRETPAGEVVRWADLCEHEVLVVPVGSAEAVATRLNAADERERRIAVSLLDLLRETRSELQVLEYFETDIQTWRQRILARRAADSAS